MADLPPFSIREREVSEAEIKMSWNKILSKISKQENVDKDNVKMRKP